MDQFRNIGDADAGKQRFRWTQFYEKVADGLLGYKDDRGNLIAGLGKNVIRNLNLSRTSDTLLGLSYLEDRYADGTTGLLRDICPFTVIGMFNRHIIDANRKIIAAELARLLGVAVPVPKSFEGIPRFHNQSSWVFPFEGSRKPDQIQALWDVFAAAIRLADSDEPSARSAFASAFDKANGQRCAGWNLTMALSWIRPWSFLSLDGKSRDYINEKLGEDIPRNGPKKLCKSNDYLSVMNILKARFHEEAYPVHSFPELSWAAVL